MLFVVIPHLSRKELRTMGDGEKTTKITKI